MQRFTTIFPHFKFLSKFQCLSFSPSIFMHTASFSCSNGTILYSTISDNSHRHVFEKTPFHDAHLCTKMITRYARNHRLKDALHVFDEMPERDIVAWNCMIKGCLDCGNLTIGKKLFDQMPERNVVSWTTMINGCMKLGKVELAEGLFKEMPLRDVAVWNAMINGYFVNGRVNEATKVFENMPSRDVISWTSMITGLDQNERSYEALRLFKQMVSNGIEPTGYTFSCLLTACVNIMAVELGTQIHGRIIKLGCVWYEFVVSPLITLYANCKRLDDSQKVFSEKDHDSVVVWTSLLTAYSSNSMHDNALSVFCEMTKIGVFPNESSFTSALNSCCSLVLLDKGQMIHGHAIKLGFQDSAYVGNSLVTLYSKCGNIQEAVEAFKDIKVKNLVSWNSILIGSGQYWLTFFAQMIRFNVEPDEITLTGLLHCASHSGMFVKGGRIFMYFRRYTTVKMNLMHYSGMLSIICRSGRVDEAEEFINNMPIKPNSLMLLEVLGACGVMSNFELAEKMSKQIRVLDPQCSAAYTLLSNIYASAGRWSDVSRIRKEMRSRNVLKEQGRSWVNQGGEKIAVLC